MTRSYYSASFEQFLADEPSRVLGELARLHAFALEPAQRHAWEEQISILRSALRDLPGGYLFLEFAIPRMGKRADAIIALGGNLFVVEFKVGDTEFRREALDQVLDYALDLKNFHAGSHSLPILPVLVATNAKSVDFTITWDSDRVTPPLCCNSETLARLLRAVPNAQEAIANPLAWECSAYKPTPTIVEAARALYRGHDVKEISRCESGAINLSRTSECVAEIIELAKQGAHKAICFITGVPGSGKTLAGLNLANERMKADEQEHAVFLSGNGPLVEVLREALIRDQCKQETNGSKLTRKQAGSKVKAFVQNIHHFRDDNLVSASPPIERVVVFDEAQRAWDSDQLSKFMRKKNGSAHFGMSEPEFLISVMDRHQDWCVIVCLVGGGQEINTGEAGLAAWFDALRIRYPDWKVYYSDRLSGREYLNGDNPTTVLQDLHATPCPDLHLSVSVRSFRSEAVSDFVHAVIEGGIPDAKAHFSSLAATYPICLTRDLSKARAWLRERARGSERIGLLASSGAIRLRPEGINIRAKVDVAYWFLNDKEDVRSSFALEEAASEFEVQGLELDWACVCWDADFRYEDAGWAYYDFKGTKWCARKDEARKNYLRNAYRVLLTRARQGMVIFVPEGSEKDGTRARKFFDGAFAYFRSLGLKEI